MKKYPLILLLFLAFNLRAQPTRSWGTYYGGNQNDGILSIATDASTNVFVCGYAASQMDIASIGSQQPNNGGLEDAFLANFDSAGVRQWGTYFGGPDNDRANFVCVDGTGNIYIAGNTSSSVSVSTAGCHQQTYGGNQDAFLAKYDNAGVLQWATYYGGSGIERGWSVAVDGSGDVYLAGSTQSTDSISTVGSHQISYGGGIRDGFIVKFNSAGVRQWGTYYGGTLEEEVRCVVIDGMGSVYFAGYSSSTNAISTLGCHQLNIGGGLAGDAFLAKFNSSGLRLWATYYGGSGNDAGKSVALDQSGNVYLAGNAGSPNNISTPGCHQFTNAGFGDAFLVKFDNSGVRQWGTNYGGSGNDDGGHVGVDALGNVFLSGDAQSANGYTTAGCYQPTYGGLIDAFAAKFSSAGVRVWGTYYGGTQTDRGWAMCLDQFGNIYLGAEAASTGVIATVGSHQPVLGGGIDGYLVKFADCAGLPNPSIVGPTVVCQGAGPTVYSVAPMALSYTWSLPGGWSGSSSTNTISATPGSSGIISIIASNACGTGVQQTLSITVSGLPTITVNGGTICSGNSFTIIPSGANTYTIEGGTAIVNPITNTTYTVLGSDLNGCVSQTAVSNVTVFALPLPTITVNSGSICLGQSFTMIPSGANTYTFQGGSAIVSPTTTNSYSVTGTSTDGCVSAGFAVSNITVNVTPDINVASSSSVLCVGQTATLTATGTNSYSWSTGSNTSTATISPTITTTYTVTGTNINGCQKTVTITQQVSPCLSAGESAVLNSKVNIFPNPNSGEFTVNLNSISEDTDIEIYNVLGEIVFKTAPTKLNSIIKVEHLANGFYQVRITECGKIISREKIIKE
jgi:hypothetical protein